jgi:hypothetical protein
LSNTERQSKKEKKEKAVGEKNNEEKILRRSQGIEMKQKEARCL